VKRLKKHIETIIKRSNIRSSNDKNRNMPGAKKALVGILMAMVVFSLFNLYSIQKDRSANQRSIDEAQSIFSMAESSYDETPESELNKGEESIEYTDEDIPEPIEEIVNLKSRNEDVVGWIKINNTNIDYPILQAEDNEYYLRRDWLGNSSIPGSIFMDFRNYPLGYNRSTTHTILYGHHIRDGSMFQNLMKYKEKEFFDENSIIEITDLYETHRFEIFAAYITSTDFYFIETRFPSRRHFTNLAGEFIDRSMHATDIEITGDDHILTLMTCTYEYDDARFVVHARRID